MSKKVTTNSNLYIGIDIHKRSWKIQLATDDFWGKTYTMPPDSGVLKEYVDKYYSGYKIMVAYEAGCCGYKPQRDFSSFGWEALIINPADISRTNKSQYQKTDKIDAALICRELKDGRLQSIQIPDTQREALRCLFRRRVELVKDFRSIKSTIIMQLLYLGIKIPEEHDNSNWTHSFRDWILKLDLNYSTSNYSLRNRLEHFKFIDLHIREVSNELRKYCRIHYKKDYNLLRSIPGIGGIVACGILSEIGDLRRFKNNKQLASYVGLIPAIRQSGDNSRTYGLTPRAKRIVRSYIVESSWQALRFDPVMQAYFKKHKGKDVKRILIKVARKLLCRARAVIVSGIEYQIGIVQ
jgi:transposase